MRGKTRSITFYPPAYTADDLARRVRATVTGTTVKGAASTPRLSKQLSPTGGRVDLVVHVPVGGGFTPLDDALVEVDGLGQFSIVNISGGRRIWRFDLARLQRKDHSSGRA